MNCSTETVPQAESPTRVPVDMPKVLIVGPSLRIMGGQAVMADRLVRAMRQDGLNVDFLPINPRPIPGLRWTEKVKGLRTLVVSFFYILSLLINVPRYDVIHLFSASYWSFVISQTPAILAARLYHKPLILNYRSGEAEDHLRTWGNTLFLILKQVTTIVVPSDYLVEVFAKFGFPAKAIFNVIDPSAIRYRYRDHAEPNIVVPRSLEPLYNVACAIRAFAIIKQDIPDAKLTILGDGSQRQELEQLVKRLELTDVTFMGRVERNQIGTIFDANDILVNTTSIDNMPVSLLEGFAAGMPIVTTDAGGIPYLIRDRHNGHLVPVNDHKAIAERVIELIRCPDEVARLSQLAAKEVEQYLWANVAQQWYHLYDNTSKSWKSNPRRISQQAKVVA